LNQSHQAQADLAVIKARGMLVKSRRMLIAQARGLVKSMGQRISQCSAEAFHRRLGEEMPEELAPALEPVMKSIEELTVRHYDRPPPPPHVAGQSYPHSSWIRRYLVYLAGVIAEPAWRY
jgi:transposase